MVVGGCFGGGDGKVSVVFSVEGLADALRLPVDARKQFHLGLDPLTE